jgi:hypothetical protein
LLANALCWKFTSKFFICVEWSMSATVKGTCNNENNKWWIQNADASHQCGAMPFSTKVFGVHATLTCDLVMRRASPQEFRMNMPPKRQAHPRVASACKGLEIKTPLRATQTCTPCYGIFLKAPRSDFHVWLSRRRITQALGSASKVSL